MRLLARLAAVLLLVPAGAWAADKKEARKQARDLQGSADLSADFQSLADGSLQGRGDVIVAPAPGAASAKALAAGRAEPAKLSPSRVPQPLVSPEGLAWQGKAKEPPWQKLSLGLTLGGAVCLLLGGFYENRRPGAPIDARPAARPSELKPSSAPRPKTPRTTSLPASSPPEPAAPSEPFVDTRMPVATWRSISLAEQKLIEAWDRSPEKAAGRASLLEWLDAQPASCVDVARLKAKLARDV